MNLSENFTLDELVYSTIAEKRDIQNVPNAEQIENLKHLAINVLQPIRNKFNCQVYIDSGFRCKELNAAVGGADSSQHRALNKDAAADLRVVKVPMADVFRYIQDYLTFDQLIWEKGSNTSPQWIHVSFSRIRNRKQVLKFNGKNYVSFKLP